MIHRRQRNQRPVRASWLWKEAGTKKKIPRVYLPRLWFNAPGFIKCDAGAIDVKLPNVTAMPRGYSGFEK
jgi:hypothetical protein